MRRRRHRLTGESKSDRRRVQRLKEEMRRLRRSGRRKRRAAREARDNPGGGFPWGKVAIGVGVALLIWRGPQLWRGVKGLFGQPTAPRPATGGPSGPSQPKTPDDIPPPPR